jgi:hypothetical protein
MCVALHRRVWERAGGMPAWLQTYEDVVFAQKLAAGKVKMALQVHAHIHHHMRSSLGELYRMARNYARGRAHAGQNDKTSVGKILLAYGMLLASAVAALFFPAAGPLFVLLLLAYLYRGGLRLLFTAERKIPSVKRIWLGSEIVVVRDVGTFVGFLLGWIDWITEPKWRQKLRAYLSPLQHRTSDAE